MKPYAKCSRCERAEPAKVITRPWSLPPDGWGEVILQVTGHPELARDFVFCVECRPYVLVGIDQLANDYAAKPARSDSGRPPANEIAAQVRRDNGED